MLGRKDWLLPEVGQPRSASHPMGKATLGLERGNTIYCGCAGNRITHQISNLTSV